MIYYELNFLKSTFCKIDIDMKWLYSFPDEYESIFVFLTWIWLFFYREPCSYFLYQEGFIWIMCQSHESLDSVNRIGKISEKFW